MIKIHLAMNDNNGRSLGKVSQIQAYNEDEHLYTLEPNFVEDMNGVCVCKIYNGVMELALGHKCFPIKSYDT